MQQLGIELKEHAAELESEWRRVLAEPPLRLPSDHDLGQLPAIISDLVDVSILQPHDIRAHEQKIRAALRHGEEIRERGWPERIIYEEFAALREALRRYLATCRLPRWKHRETLVRLDMAISVAELSAVRGYHRATFAQLGRWEDLPAQLARESPLLGMPVPDARP